MKKLCPDQPKISWNVCRKPQPIRNKAGLSGKSSSHHGFTTRITKTDSRKRERPIHEHKETWPVKKRRISKTPASHSGVICLPLELMLDIAARCDTEDILALTQTCVQFRNQCAAIYLNRLGIYSKDQHGIQICLALGPFSAWSVSMLLCLETYTGSRISLAVDYYHIVALLPNIQSLLKKIPISDFELRLSEDEHDLLRIRRLFPAIPSVLAHLPRQCSRVSFTTISPEERRPCLKHYDDIASAFKPPKKFRSKPLASVTQLNLSTPFLDHGALRDPIGTLLHQPGIHMLSINCETTNDSDYVLKRANLRNLELLTVRLSNNSMATLPTSFPKHHTKLRSICLLTCCPWDSQSFERSKTCVSLPSLRYATLSSKYLKFHVQDASSLRDLKISSFMAFPIPQNRGYCTVFQSLLSIWVHSKPAVFRPSFTASFIFPHRLNEHLAFCKEVPIYRCSCTHLPDGLHNIPGVQHVELEMDSLTVEAMVFIRNWVQPFSEIRKLEIIASDVSLTPKDLPSLSFFQAGSPTLLSVYYSERSQAPIQLL